MLGMLIGTLLFVNQQMERLTRMRTSDTAVWDSLQTLLRQKDENTRQMVSLMGRTADSLLLEADLSRIMERQDTVVTHRQVKTQVVTRHDTIRTPIRERKGFFKRLGEVFAPPKEDTTVQVQVTTEVSTDTLTTLENTNVVDSLEKLLLDAARQRHELANRDRRRQRYWGRMDRQLSVRMDSLLKGQEQQVLAQAREHHALAVLLAGRPYHTDPLIQHKVSDMVAAMGVYVITDDIVRSENISIADTIYLSQWAYPNRIMKAAKWVGAQGQDVQFMQLTSFGCGPDAFLVNEVRATLERYHKNLTLLKIDDVSNVGSIKLRVRSLVESIGLGLQGEGRSSEEAFETTPVFTKAERRRKLIAPFFTPFLSPLIPSAMKVAGFDVENLPMSDEESCDLGLKYSNNEVCYPATLIVGDVVKAFKSGKYNPDETAVIITQTGGQCRASSYLSLIKKALVDAGVAGGRVRHTVAQANPRGAGNNAIQRFDCQTLLCHRGTRVRQRQGRSPARRIPRPRQADNRSQPSEGVASACSRSCIAFQRGLS